MDTNKQESYILPECCNNCVEDGFLGAKGCSNRECECHKESHEGVEELLHEFAAEYPNETVILGQHNKMQLSDWLRTKLTSLNTKKHE